MNRTSKRAVIAGLCVAAASIQGSSAWADAVTAWNDTAEATSALAGGPPFRNRINAMAQIAVHDALNTIDPRFDRYVATGTAKPGASPEAAIAAAAYRVLATTVPGQAGALGLLYANRISEIDECPASFPTCIEDGIVVGEAAANAILALRANDGSTTPHLPYTLLAGSGVYQPTPPAFAAPQFAGWAHLTPFVLRTGSQFRAEPSEIFDLSSEAYARDYNEVKRVGSVNAEANGDRTPDQSAIARYWPGGGSNWNSVARVIVAGRGLDEWYHARLFALLNMALSDGAVAVFDTKYTYNFWRPATAIRAGETDGNPQTAGDPTWLSYQTTPLYPDYTCGLTNSSGAAVEVLRRYFSTDRLPYTFTAAGITRSYETLSQAAAESVDARVFGGMHFRTGCIRGVTQGEQVGRFVSQHALKLVRGKDLQQDLTFNTAER